MYLTPGSFANALEGLRTTGAASGGKSLTRKRRCSRLDYKSHGPAMGSVEDLSLRSMRKASIDTLANEQCIAKSVLFETNY